MKRWRFQGKLLVAAGVFFALVLVLCIQSFKQPDVCALCGSGARERYHAPVILNLSTGLKNEMRVYDTDFPTVILRFLKSKPPAPLALRPVLD